MEVRLERADLVEHASAVHGRAARELDVLHSRFAARQVAQRLFACLLACDVEYEAAQDSDVWLCFDDMKSRLKPVWTEFHVAVEKENDVAGRGVKADVAPRGRRKGWLGRRRRIRTG